MSILRDILLTTFFNVCPLKWNEVMKTFSTSKLKNRRKLKKLSRGKKILEKVDMKDKGSTFFVLARFTGVT